MIDLALLVATTVGGAGVGTELRDYLVQDVCVDGRDRAISGDPASCARHRDVRAGEALPYLLTDRSHRTGVTYEAQSSFPVTLRDGTPAVMISRSLVGNFGPGYVFAFVRDRSSYDLLDLTHAPYTSFVRTFDGGCFDQLWSGNGKTATFADRAGGWINFPRRPAPSSWPRSSSLVGRTFHLQLPGAPARCRNGNALGVTFWSAPATHAFENGWHARAIVSDHFANARLDDRNNALERYIFTREYGNTRWESWIPQQRCLAEKGAQDPICRPDGPAYPLAEFCRVADGSATGTPGLDRWGGQLWVRTACRDHTHYIPLDRPQRMLDATMARTNGYIDLR